MRPRVRRLSNFTNAIHRQSPCFRPENETQLEQVTTNFFEQQPLARGAGLSYSDCCLNDQKPIIDCNRLNHFISFDDTTGLLICQPGITFLELFNVHPDFIPPVIPGTLKATLGGGIANDVHGKNNDQEGSLGHHIEWIELQLANRTIYCSRVQNQDLFLATIGGLGLTGVIKRLALILKKSTRFVECASKPFTTWHELLQSMQKEAQDYDYQAAWLDLLNVNASQRSVLTLANHCQPISDINSTRRLHITIPRLPLRVINSFVMKQFNRIYFNTTQSQKNIKPLNDFNNPLDKLNHWNRLYGKKGLVQFQAVFDVLHGEETLKRLVSLIHSSQATPTLAVLKYFSQAGEGLLSFVKPGFTIAIDFICNQNAVNAIQLMNQMITRLGGQIYLGKDLFLTQEQFKQQYPNQGNFCEILTKYYCASESDLSRRLGIVRL